eukprot:15353661-Ditylum_brightwellii.AAC.1
MDNQVQKFHAPREGFEVEMRLRLSGNNHEVVVEYVHWHHHHPDQLEDLGMAPSSSTHHKYVLLEP